MLATFIQPALGGQTSQAFLGKPCSEEAGDNSVLLSSNGNLYRLEGILGTGGLSVVYRATRFSDGMSVALKIANLQKAGEAGELLCREAELLARLDHPNIEKLLDSGTTRSGDPFIALELLEGQTLEQLLISETVLDLPRVVRICLQVAEAIQHAHDRGVLHCDIKPGNIILVEKDGVETAKVCDFGISLVLDNDGSSYDGSGCGSLLYASPEQLGEERCSYNTDVYQLALVMFEALTGRLPFEISVAGALDYRRGSGPVLLSADELGEQRLHDGIRRVLEEALNRNPIQRTHSMRNFIEKLNQALCQLGAWSLRSSMV